MGKDGPLETRYAVMRVKDGISSFVLDYQDKYAPPALRAYADACEGEYPLLAADLRKKAQELEAAHDQD